VQIITITATDGAGNRSSDKLTVTYDAADTTAPTVAITSPTTKTYYFSRTDTVAIGGKASDEGGIAKVTWRNSRGESGTCNGTDNWQASGIKLNRWWNTVTVTAIDKAGNTDEYSLKVFRWNTKFDGFVKKIRVPLVITACTPHLMISNILRNEYKI
jgi:hypothetical protein